MLAGAAMRGEFLDAGRLHGAARQLAASLRPLTVAGPWWQRATHLRQLDREYRQTAFLEGIGLNTGGLILSALVGQAMISRLGVLWTPRHLTWWTVGGLVALYAGYTLTNLLVMGIAVTLRAASPRETSASIAVPPRSRGENETWSRRSSPDSTPAHSPGGSASHATPSRSI